MAFTVGKPLLNVAAAIAIAALLAGCNNEVVAQQRAAPAKQEIGAQTLQPQTVALTAELPGRTSAHLVSEVRPRVTGIVRSRSFEEGSNVKAGDVLYELDPAPFEASFRNAAATLKRAEGAVPSARARVERYTGLNRREAVSRQDLDDAQTALLQAEADVASAQAALETARINLDYAKIRAPIDGRIDASSVTPGALVTADQASPLATIRQLDLINVDLVQSSANVLRINKALAAQQLKSNGEAVTVELLLEDGSRYEFPGRMAFLGSAVSSATGTVSLRAIFPNPTGLLMPGMYVRAIIEEGYVENSFLVPQRAVSRNPRGEATARFINADMKIEERVLGVERNVGNSWLVNSGVSSGDRIVVEGMQRIRVGDEVVARAVIVDERTGEVRPEDQQASNAARADGVHASAR